MDGTGTVLTLSLRKHPGQLTTPSSPMGTPLSPSAFESLTPTLWALLNQSDPARSTEVFSAVVDYFTRQQTNATVDGRTGEAKLRAGEFIARCVLVRYLSLVLFEGAIEEPTLARKPVLTFFPRPPPSRADPLLPFLHRPV